MTTGMTTGMMVWSTIGLAAAALGAWYVATRRMDVPCTLELEASHDTFHAHVHLEGVAVDCGDEVLVHGAPSRVPFGTQRRMAAHATVHRASWLRRQVVKLTGGTEFYELYDVGFEG